MSRWTLAREHIWRDEHGNAVLRHRKFLTPDGVTPFPWSHRVRFGETGIERWFRGNGADEGIVHPLIYPRDVFARARTNEHVYICEGEKDADALAGAGVLAVTAGGVCDFKIDHARLFKRWRGRISIIRDNDLPGAMGAVRTYDLLREVGIETRQVRIARGRCPEERADAFDHLSAGYTVEQFVSEPLGRVRALAAEANQAAFSRAGYGDWVVVSPEEVGQLRDWKPKRVKS